MSIGSTPGFYPQANTGMNTQNAMASQPGQAGATQFGQKRKPATGPKFGFVDGGIVSGPACCATACCGPIIGIPLLIGAGFAIRGLYKKIAGAFRNRTTPAQTQA